MGPRTGSIMGGSRSSRSASAIGNVSSGGRMKETYGIKRAKQGRGSGQKLRDVYNKATENGQVRTQTANSNGYVRDHGNNTLSSTFHSNGYTELCESPFYSRGHRTTSTGSTDSNGSSSDGQSLCTGERCVMDGSHKSPTGQTDPDTSRNGELRKRNVVAKLDGVARSGKLCHSCRGEMMHNEMGPKHGHKKDGEGKDLEKRGMLYRQTKAIRRSITEMMPKWLSEPEFMMHATPRTKDRIHRNTDSLFSTSSGFTNYYGILNLGMILLVLGNARLFLENIIKYGILINLSFFKFFLREPYNWPNLLLTLCIPIFPAIALCTEKLLAKNWISDRTGFVIYFINLSTLLLGPAGVIYYLHPFMFFSVLTLGIVTISFLKLISYGHTNYWCRETYRSPKLRRSRSVSTGSQSSMDGTAVAKNNVYNTANLQSYPDNLNINDMVYYMFAPTICYELNFPRSARIRKRFLVKRLVEMAFLNWLMIALIQQWIVPALNNARQPLAEMEAFKVLERLLKLAIPNHLIWLVFFYSFFHSALNVVAELTRFGDREFYNDWWNSEAVSDFWKDWNIPVHRFAIRHIYKPLLRKGVPKIGASTIVFLVSAFFHEYLVSVPLRMFKAWAFMGMLMQVPTAYYTGKYIKGKWGNIVMWLSLILGQPVAILAYFHDYYITHSLPLHNATSPGM